MSILNLDSSGAASSARTGVAASAIATATEAAAQALVIVLTELIGDLLWYRPDDRICPQFAVETSGPWSGSGMSRSGIPLRGRGPAPRRRAAHRPRGSRRRGRRCWVVA